MGAEPPLLGRGGIERVPVGLGHPTKRTSWGPGLLQLHGSSLVAAAMALATRLAAARRPERRAQRLVGISVTSHTRSSSTSDGSPTSNRRPCAASAASTYSASNRANRSRCSPTIVVAELSRRRAKSLRRLPFSAEPISVTTRPTAKLWAAAHALTRATLRSRSDLWSAEDTRASTAVIPGTVLTGGWSTRISRPARRAGTGSLPSRNQRRQSWDERLVAAPSPSRSPLPTSIGSSANSYRPRPTRSPASETRCRPGPPPRAGLPAPLARTAAAPGCSARRPRVLTNSCSLGGGAPTCSAMSSTFLPSMGSVSPIGDCRLQAQLSERRKKRWNRAWKLRNLGSIFLRSSALTFAAFLQRPSSSVGHRAMAGNTFS